MSERGPWFVNEMLCLACGHRWVAVHPGGALTFECAACGENEGVRDED